MSRENLTEAEKREIALFYANAQYQVHCSKYEIGNDGRVFPKDFSECEIFMHYYDLMLGYQSSEVISICSTWLTVRRCEPPLYNMQTFSLRLFS